MTLALSQYDQALLDKLFREAEQIETHLYGGGRFLLTKPERQNLKDALATRHARMAQVLNRYATKAPKATLP